MADGQIGRLNQLSVINEPLRIERVEIRLLRMPLVEPFETSFGVTGVRTVFLVGLDAGAREAGAKSWRPRSRFIVTKPLARPGA